MKLLRIVRILTFAMTGIFLLFQFVGAQALPEGEQPIGGTIPPNPPVLSNTDFECTTGYYTQTIAPGNVAHIPNDWQLALVKGTPIIHSARIFFAGSCDGSAHVERISGIDSIVVRAADIETPPEPGKPFDVAFYQQISATVGGDYSLSGWLLSLCGGSATPSDCPEDVYIAKMLGIDPTGGIDPTANTVIWTENRRNFWEGERVGWQQLSVSVQAKAETMTVFARINSPHRWHGNHAFIDALSLVRAPSSELLVPETVTGTAALLLWQGSMQPEITSQPGSTHELRFDVQMRHEATPTWQDLVTDRNDTDSTVFTANCIETNYLFRIRARAEQRDDVEGAWPNHRYHGLWSDPVPVYFVAPPVADSETMTPVTTPEEELFQLFLPILANQKQC
ncbi:MAG: hypothetical protein KDE19_06760 [Caldilineaceae bacterium]|nr:hypothetical protein [Caldilineaceae bacterium]